MNKLSKKAWFLTAVTAGLVLTLGLLGGKWGTSFTATAYVNAAPVIDSLDPSAVPMNSPDTLITITGSNFGNEVDTAVRITGGGVDRLLAPQTITASQITAVISDTLLVKPLFYTLVVIKTTDGTPPTIPTIPNPPNEEISNPVGFTVWSPDTYFPLVHKDSR